MAGSVTDRPLTWNHSAIGDDNNLVPLRFSRLKFHPEAHGADVG